MEVAGTVQVEVLTVAQVGVGVLQAAVLEVSKAAEVPQAVALQLVVLQEVVEVAAKVPLLQGLGRETKNKKNHKREWVGW